MKRVESEPMLRTGDICRLFKVNRKTVMRWVKAGKIPSIVTPGGTHRFPEAEILALLPVLSAKPAAQDVTRVRDVKDGDWVVLNGDKVKVVEVLRVLVLESGEEVQLPPTDPIKILRDESWTPSVGGGN